MPASNQTGERICTGIAVSGGVAQGRVQLLGATRPRIPEDGVPPEAIPAEIERLNAALVATRRDLQAVQEKVASALGAHEAGVFEAHLLVLEDPALLDEVRRLLESGRCNAARAFHTVAERYAEALAAMEDSYLRERSADLRDVADRVVGHLLGIPRTEDISRLAEPRILVAPDLAPSTTALLDRQKVLGFATDAGGKTSHTAIMARKLGIPAVVGLGDITRQVRTGDHILLDGHGGRVILNPTDQTLFEYGQLKRRRARFEERLEALSDQPAVTLDGHRIHLAANIDHPDDVESVRRRGAEGVGLFRSEFLFLNRPSFPDEEEQYAAYHRVASALAPAPVVIRTLDLGGDKIPGTLHRGGEPNPFLGWRAIRICLDHPELFRTQLRAILRASAAGHVKLLYPMVSSLEELQAANRHLQECREALTREGIAFDPEMEVGVMIEVPGAALIADVLAREVDFFSIGTNDLTGYTLAVDRLNERVAPLFDPAHPGVVRLIHLAVQAARRHGRWVGVCGETAGEPALVPLLVGLGVTELSASPSVVPQVKFVLRRLRLDEASAMAAQALEAGTAGAVQRLSADLARSMAPELFHPA